MSNGKSTIMIVDDHPLFRKGLQRFIAYEEDLEVTKECHSGAEALESALQDDPDLILLVTVNIFNFVNFKMNDRFSIFANYWIQYSVVFIESIAHC